MKSLFQERNIDSVTLLGIISFPGSVYLIHVVISYILQDVVVPLTSETYGLFSLLTEEELISLSLVL